MTEKIKIDKPRYNKMISKYGKTSYRVNINVDYTNSGLDELGPFKTKKAALTWAIKHNILNTVFHEDEAMELAPE